MREDEVLEVYSVLFGPESIDEQRVRRQARRFATKQGLANRLIHREPFLGPENRQQLRKLPVSDDLVRESYRLFLDREPSASDLKRETSPGFLDFLRSILRSAGIMRSHWDLLQSVLRSTEYKRKSSAPRLMKTRSFNAVPRTIFLHIPKTAGKSFEQLAIRNYGREAVSLSTSGRFSASEWNRSAMVGGHFIYSKFDGMRGKRLFLAVVRDPVERALSRFNYYVNARHQQDFRRERGFDNNDPYKTMLHSAYREEFIDNYQCRYLSGDGTFKKVTEVLGRDAFILGTYVQIQDWVSVVGSRLGWSEIELDKINAASDPEYLKRLSVNEALAEQLRERNQDDYALYNFVKQHGVYESAGAGFDYSDFGIACQLEAIGHIDDLHTSDRPLQLVRTISQALRRPFR